MLNFREISSTPLTNCSPSWDTCMNSWWEVGKAGKVGGEFLA